MLRFYVQCDDYAIINIKGDDMSNKLGLDENAVQSAIVKTGVESPDELEDRVQILKESAGRLIPHESVVLGSASDRIPFDIGQWIYFLIDGESIVYIGKTTSPAARIGEHIKTKRFSRVLCIDTGSALNQDLAELIAIKFYRPELNSYIPSQGDITKRACKYIRA